jgi:FkbM family methyltransferase
MRRALSSLTFGIHPAIRQVLPRGHRAYPTPSGRLYLDLRESPMMLARALGVYEPATRAAIREVLRPGDAFVDAGASKGDFSLLASLLVGPRGRVVAVEPAPANAYWLRRSIAVNDARNVEAIEAALGEDDGAVAELQLAARSGWHTLAPLTRWNRDIRGMSSVVQVPVRSLDALLSELGIEKVAALKIDVEGSELDVLRGAERTLSKIPPPTLFIEVHPTLGVDPDQVRRFLRERGFELSGAEAPDPETATMAIVARRSTQVLSGGRGGVAGGS